jgi:hypothetical protein
MYPRVEDFRVLRNDNEYDPERGLRRGSSRYSGAIALLLLVYILVAALIGSSVVFWTADAGQAWTCKSGEWSGVSVSAADCGAVAVPHIQARLPLDFKI